jgi:hypothetical protein
MSSRLLSDWTHPGRGRAWWEVFGEDYVWRDLTHEEAVFEMTAELRKYARC